MSRPFLSEEERRRVEAAIRAAEARTTGEFVAVVARASDQYPLLPILYATVAAFAVPPLVWAAGAEPALPWAYGAQTAAFALLALLLNWTPLTMRIVPRALKERSAARLAREQFFALGLHETRGRTGVLLFVSIAERYVEILADRGVADRTTPDLWDKVVAEFTDNVRRGRAAEGFLAAVQACGALMAEHFPRGPADRDELPDVLIQI